MNDWIDHAGPAAPLLFIAVYAIGTVLFFPGSLLTLAGGAVFGPLWGTLYNLTGATLGASLAFLVARYLGADWVTHRAGPRLTALREGIEQEGWRFVAFTRLVPLFPFNLLNYALGLTRIGLVRYVVTSFVCMVPGGFAYTWLGYAGREAVAGGEGLIRKGLLALALLAAVAFLPRLIGRLRRGPTLTVDTLAGRLETGEDLLVLDVRSPEEFSGELGHIDGARNLPLPELEARMGELAGYQEHPVAVVCRTDRRSAMAARLLAAHGFAKVHVVAGGMTAWNRSGLATRH
jgi:uncharacterized membrane protein YdjX (TVP38/TMEM64 family)/rhodanese-related sulfurtransferase